MGLVPLRSRRRARGRWTLLSLILVLLLASVGFVFEGFVGEILGESGIKVTPPIFVPGRQPLQQTLLVTTSKREVSSTSVTSLLPAATALTWQEEAFEPHRQSSPVPPAPVSPSPQGANSFLTTNTTNATWVPIYNDPFDVTRSIFYGPWRAELPSEIFAGEPFRLIFHCTSPDPSMCPNYYLVMFHGPSRQTIPPHKFRPSNIKINYPFSWNIIEADWTIDDPGDYSVYAYPEFGYRKDSKRLYCKLWKETMYYPWHKAAVEGCPIHLTVKLRPNTNEIEEGYGVCSPQDLKKARYRSTNAVISGQRFANFYNNTRPLFVWTPYKCKIPHRSVHQAIAEIPSAKHIVLIGDSTLRGPFCTRIWENLHGTVQDSVCDYRQHNDTYWEQKWGHKFTWKLFKDVNTSQTSQRNVSFSFLWSPVWFQGRGLPELLNMHPPPTHVVFNMGLWLAWHNTEQLQAEYWGFLENMKKHFAGTVQHIILRTTVSVVQAVNCFGDTHFMYADQMNRFPDGPPSDSIDFRIGGSQKRKAMFTVAHHWNQMHRQNPPFRLSVVDAWEYTDNRPEATSEGRHWVSEDEGAHTLRPYVGEADDSILDRIWDDFINERITNDLLNI